MKNGNIFFISLNNYIEPVHEGSLFYNCEVTLTVCIRVTSKRILLQTVKTKMKCRMMWHFSRVYTAKVNKDLQRKNTMLFFFLNYNPTSLDMYNGLSQVYCIKPEGRIH